MDTDKDLNLPALGYSFDAENKFWARLPLRSFSYSDGEEAENRLYQAVVGARDVSVSSPELRAASIDWPSKYHFSSARGNILRPLADKLRGHILEIGAGCGAITRYLGENGGMIYAIEGSTRRARIAAARVRDLDNVCVINDSFEDFRPDFKFDAITLIGVLEYAGAFGKGIDPVQGMLELTRKLLKPSGILIVAIENQLGLKYFAGMPEDHLSLPMIGLHDLYPANGVKTFGRVELEKRIERAGFESIQLALPFPDYKLATSIVLPRGVKSDTSFDASSLAAQTASRDLQISSKNLNFSLDCVWRVLKRNNLFADTSNSFLYVASPAADTVIFDSKDLAYHYSTDRKPEFCKQVSFSLSGGGGVLALQKYIYESPNGRGVGSVIDTDYLHVIPSEQYYVGTVFGETIVKEFQRPRWGIKEISKLFRIYLDVLSAYLAIDFEEDGLDTIVPGTVLDAVPQNLVETSEGYRFFDQEWSSRDVFPVGYLVFRSITTVVRMVSSFAEPADTRWLNQGRFFQEIFAHLGFDFTRDKFDEYSRRESNFMSYATGVLEQPATYEEWSVHRLPSYLDRAEALTAPLIKNLIDVQNLADTYIAQIKWLESESILKEHRIMTMESQSQELLDTLNTTNETFGESNTRAAKEIIALKMTKESLEQELLSIRSSRCWKIMRMFARYIR